MTENRPAAITSAIPAPVSVVPEPKIRTAAFTGDGMVMLVAQDEQLTAFAGLMENSTVPSVVRSLSGQREKMLVQAVNNRTRERNYYQLYSRLLENEISDEEFDNELDSNPDKYVISTDVIPSDEEFQDAIMLSEHILDTETSGDIESLFSFNGEEFNKKCKKLLNGTL